MAEKRMAVAGSRRVPVAGATRIQTVDSHDRVEATIVLRRSPKVPQPMVPTSARLTRVDFAAAHGADPSELTRVERFAHDHGLTVVASHVGRRTVQVAGPASAITSAFGTELSYYESPEGQYRGRVGAVTVPEDIASVVDAVLGLDNRPIAKPHVRRHAEPHAADRALLPTEVAKAYNFPTTSDGTGETIGIIELGGGFKQADLDTYFTSLKLAKRPTVSAFSVLGATSDPGTDQNADGEVMLDIEVAGAIAPGANIVVYFAPNTDQGFHDAIASAVHDDVNKPSVISISWGSAEANWTRQAINVMNAALQDAAALGVTVTVAAGDNGSSDGLKRGNHVDFPAASPFALGCGGTTLEVTATGAIQNEVVWNEAASNEGATGGGFSSVFALPDYQKNSNAAKHGKKRGVPDVSGNADPATGYRVLVDGSSEVIGGTSAVAPLWAGLVALLNQQTGTPLGFMQPNLYAHAPAGFHDIITGDNGAFQAASGWDPTTGLGTPNAAHLVGATVTT
jgi:kumamolisin